MPANESNAAKAPAPAKAPRNKAAEAAAATPIVSKVSHKLVRDSFTMPRDEYAAIDALKARALRLGRQAKKSELLRAGLSALVGMTDRSFAKALQDVPTLKTGRPKGESPAAEEEPAKEPAKKAARKSGRR